MTSDRDCGPGVPPRAGATRLSTGEQPPWWRDAVFYEVYVRSFADSNGDGVGDLVGIADRLDHLVWLGIDAIWLTPFFDSSQHDMGYDVTDYCAVDPLHGTMQDFDTLVRRAHEYDIRVVLDLVPNHTSSDHPWFVESRSSVTSPKRDWYLWRRGHPDGGPPTNWRGQVDNAPGGAWVYDPETDEWYLANFSRWQPELNWANAAVRHAMGDVVTFWSQHGADGFRIDMADHLAKDPQFRNETEPPGSNFRDRQAAVRYQSNRPESRDHVAGLRRSLTRPGQQVLAGELSYHAPIATLTAWGQHSVLDIPLNFRLTYLDFDAPTLTAFISDYDEQCRASNAWPNYCLGNHDTARATRLGHRYRAALILLLTLRGTPFLYYGDEIGMHDIDIAPEDRRDPWVSASRDGARTPLLWQPGPGVGFSDGPISWLPAGNPLLGDTVQGQRNDTTSPLHLVRDLLTCRRRLAALRRGEQQFLTDLPAGVLGFRRVHRDGGVRVLMNLADEPVTLADQRHRDVLVQSHQRPGAPEDPFVLLPGEAVVISEADLDEPTKGAPA